MRTTHSELKRQKRRLSEVNAELVAQYNPRAASLFVNITAEIACLEAFEALPNRDNLGRYEMFRAGFRACRDIKEGKRNVAVSPQT